jgi:hypothetical protein
MTQDARNIKYLDEIAHIKEGWQLDGYPDLMIRSVLMRSATG